MEKSYINHY
ncbi:hypothetical protein [Plasmodium yoelii yoelii]|uniref:Uncharacterized protein n=1 Tax=Plasmodium yoelii yoelii TaxID=73239 RepID=Q7RHC2_PLAYO|nr:hypothetical protein [Plasmodium yoelii yoelii]